jgi:outer membrane protein OmpA-like peptidoglycan-associated protein
MRSLFVGTSLVALMAPTVSAQQAAEPVPLSPPTVYAQQSAAPAPTETTEFLVFFGLDEATLDAEARRVVAEAAEAYRTTGTARVEVRGYTDTSGAADYNEALSERRAEAVAEELIGLGVPPAAITRAGLGETELLVQTGDGVREPSNRRAEVELERPLPPPPVEEPAPVAAAPAAPAQEPRRGLFSLGALYGFNLLDEGGDGGGDKESHLAGLNLGFDYGVTDWLALSLEQAGFYNFLSEDDGFGGRSAAGLNLTVGLVNVIPYVGGNIGYLYGSGLDDDFFAGPEVGLSLGPLNAKVAYDIPFGRDLDEGIIVTTLGLGIGF